MNIFSFFRRTRSRHADDSAVEDFTRVLKQTEAGRADELARLIGKDDATPADVDQIGKLLNGD